MPTGQSLLRNQVIYVQGQEEPKNPQFGLIEIYGQLNILAVMNRKKNKSETVFKGWHSLIKSLKFNSITSEED